MNAVALNGAFVGLIYGLVGVGIVVIYRGSRVVNFAYGETGMLVAFVFTDLRFGAGQQTFDTDERGLWVALPVGIALAAALGAATELVTVRRMRHAPRIRPLVATLAVGVLFFTFATRRWGTDNRYAKPLIEGDGVRVLGLQIRPQQLLILAVSVGVLLGLWALYRFTAFGLRLRATALDPYAAGLVGVDVNRTSIATWALAGGLAGLSAILIAPLVGFNVAFVTVLFIRGLASALVGGLTSIGGTFVAGILIGIAEAIIAYRTPISGITDVALAALVLCLMLARPRGLIRAAY